MSAYVCSHICLEFVWGMLWRLFALGSLWAEKIIPPVTSVQLPGPGSSALLTRARESCGSNTCKQGTHLSCSCFRDHHYDRWPLTVVFNHAEFKAWKECLYQDSFCIFGRSLQTCLFEYDSFLTRPLILICFHITNTNQKLCKAQLFWTHVTSKNVSGITTTIC